MAAETGKSGAKLIKLECLEWRVRRRELEKVRDRERMSLKAGSATDWMERLRKQRESVEEGVRCKSVKQKSLMRGERKREERERVILDRWRDRKRKVNRY